MHVCKHVGMCICILLFAGNTYLSSHATWHQQRGQARLAPPSHGRSKTPPLIENLLWVGSRPTKQLISLEVSALGCRQSLNAVPAPSRDPSLKQGDLAAELKKKVARRPLSAVRASALSGKASRAPTPKPHTEHIKCSLLPSGGEGRLTQDPRGSVLGGGAYTAWSALQEGIILSSGTKRAQGARSKSFASEVKAGSAPVSHLALRQGLVSAIAQRFEILSTRFVGPVIRVASDGNSRGLSILELRDPQRRIPTGSLATLALLSPSPGRLWRRPKVPKSWPLRAKTRVPASHRLAQGSPLSRLYPTGLALVKKRSGGSPACSRTGRRSRQGQLLKDPGVLGSPSSIPRNSPSSARRRNSLSGASSRSGLPGSISSIPASLLSCPSIHVFGSSRMSSCRAPSLTRLQPFSPSFAMRKASCSSSSSESTLANILSRSFSLSHFPGRIVCISSPGSRPAVWGAWPDAITDVLRPINLVALTRWSRSLSHALALELIT